jgi:hypothetical protein
MRKEYGNVLRRSFARNMRARLPQFDPFKIDSDYVLPGERIFRWLPEDELHCFVILVPSRKSTDEFTIEIGWSTRGRFPERARPAGIASPERSEFGEEEFTCRMNDLWATGDVWWQVTEFDPMDPESQLSYILAGAKPISAEEAQAAVAPKVEDAIEKLVDHGVPYLEEYVRSQREGA